MASERYGMTGQDRSEDDWLGLYDIVRATGAPLIFGGDGGRSGRRAGEVAKRDIRRGTEGRALVLYWRLRDTLEAVPTPPVGEKRWRGVKRSVTLQRHIEARQRRALLELRTKRVQTKRRSEGAAWDAAMRAWEDERP